MANNAFYGRSEELSSLNFMYDSHSFEMMVIYGRRRIGKTTLINKFCENKNVIFYTGIEGREKENRKGLGKTVFQYFHPGMAEVSFPSFSDILSFISDSIESGPSDRRLLIVLDEYPYIARTSPEFASVLQREIDNRWNRLNIMLILSGSSITFMEDEVLSSKSPLFGRRTGQIDLRPFDYLTSALFVPEYSAEDKAIVYGVTGGVPKYLSMIDPAVSLKDNLVRQFFSASGYFFEEPKNMLREEFRDVPLYHSIISAIARGNSALSEICSKTGLDSPVVSPALKKLTAIRVIDKEVPILNDSNKRLHRYVIRDSMFRFWFRFVPEGINLIERGYGRTYYDQAVQPHLHEYMGTVFEEICREYTFLQGMKGNLGMMISEIGKWRGSDPLRKCQTDIDVVAISKTEKEAVIGECKFRNERFGKQELDTLLDRARLIRGYHVIHFLLFSLSGFTDAVMEEIGKTDQFTAADIDDLYHI